MRIGPPILPPVAVWLLPLFPTRWRCIACGTSQEMLPTIQPNRPRRWRVVATARRLRRLVEQRLPFSFFVLYPIRQKLIPAELSRAKDIRLRSLSHWMLVADVWHRRFDYFEWLEARPEGLGLVVELIVDAEGNFWTQIISKKGWIWGKTSQGATFSRNKNYLQGKISIFLPIKSLNRLQ